MSKVKLDDINAKMRSFITSIFGLIQASGRVNSFEMSPKVEGLLRVNVKFSVEGS